MTTSSSIWLSVGRVMSQKETETEGLCYSVGGLLFPGVHFPYFLILKECVLQMLVQNALVCNSTTENKSTHTKQRIKRIP